MKQIGLILIIVFLVFSVQSGCKSNGVETLPETTSDQEMFRLGEESIDKDPEKGRLYFRQLIDSFPKSFYAQRAKLAIADSFFEQGDEASMIIASSEYREFISLFPYSPSAAYAQYQIGMTFFKKILSPGRDQTKTQQALAEFKVVVSRYPLSEEATNARDRIQECEERLAEHSSTIAIHYYKRAAFKASISRLTEILTEYPSYTKMDKVYYYLADSYYKSNLIEQCIPYYRKLISDYPESKFAAKAIERMDEIEKKARIKSRR